jgi:protein JBTS26
MAKFLEEQKVEQDLELALDVIDVAAPQKKASAKKPARKTQEQRFQEKIAAFEQEFVMPEMPRGQKLEFNIVQTWGDINYLGLTGIEVFDGQGRPIHLEAGSITATPCDINLLMGYGNDPRTVDKLVDGTYFTQDDFHAWLTPFTQGEDHTISIDLGSITDVSLIRIWNYNKSRIHSHRGARLVTATLDDQTIFRGEVKRAPGNTNDLGGCCELLLFTESDDVMVGIDANDWVNSVPIREEV